MVNKILLQALAETALSGVIRPGTQFAGMLAQL
jgi:hypothetical protein